jgi:hypothetical protein
MRFKSVSSILTDSYRAGAEIGDALREIVPEVILLFASIGYEQNVGDLFDGIRENLGSSGTLIFGGTGDGIYETSRVANYGVCALGIHSGGKLRWSAWFEKGVSTDSYSAARTCALKSLARLDGQAGFAFVLADGVKADGSGIVAGVNSVLRIPYFGGLTGDDRKFTRSRVLFDGQALEDAVAILIASGEVSVSINSASGWSPIGTPGVIEGCDGNSIQRISGVSAQAFMKEQLGKPLGESDLGTIPLATYPPEGTDPFSLRSLTKLDPHSGAVHLFGSVVRGTSVRVCTATREEIIGGVSTALEGLRLGKEEGMAVVVVSCAGRKWLLEDQGKSEVERILANLGRKIPLVGFPSFGEIGPFRKPDGATTETYFHNVTCVLCVIGG